MKLTGGNCSIRRLRKRKTRLPFWLVLDAGAYRCCGCKEERNCQVAIHESMNHYITIP